MPDAAEELRRDLLAAIAADAATARARPPDAVRARGRRRRRTRRLVAGTTVLAVATFAAQVPWPGRDDEAPSRLAGIGAQAPVLLDEGTAADGPWTLVVTEDLCLERTTPSSSGGLCGLANPGRLQESSSFRIEDDGEPVVVVHGPADDGTSVLRVELADRAPVEVTPVLVEGRLFYSARTPADARITDVVALGEDGEVLARLGELPPPPP